MHLYSDEDIQKEIKKTKDMVRKESMSNREKEIHTIIDSLHTELEEINTRKTFKCPECEKRTKITKLTIVDAYHYIRPYSCTGGDYWVFSNEYYVICPKCDVANRSYIGSFDESTPFDEKSESDQTRIRRYYFISKYHKYFGEHLKLYNSSGIHSIDLDALRADKKKEEDKTLF